MLILSAINPEQALSDDEAELMELDLAAVAAGSTEALERLYNTAKAAVYSYSLSVLRNVQDAEDVLHDCFVNIFTAAAGYRPHGKPLAWIITIAKNLCFARLRQHNRQEQLPDEDWSEMLADNAGLSNEDRLVLRECLGRLSEEENSIVTELSYPDLDNHLKGFNPMIYPDLELSYRVSVQGRQEDLVVTVDLDRPVPAEFAGKLCFNMELFPGELFGKPWIMDGKQGVFPRQPNGPTMSQKANYDHSGKFPMPEGGVSREFLAGNNKGYNPIVADDLIAEPYAVGQRFTCRPDDAYSRFTIESEGAPLKLYDGRMNHNNGWFVLSSEIPEGKTEGAIRWIIKPNVVPGWLSAPVVQVSQVGYHPAQPKVAIVELDRNDPARGQAALVKITENGEDALYNDIEFPLAQVLADMTRTGVLVDKDGIEQFGVKLRTELEQVLTRIHMETGSASFNPNSPKQLGEMLFDTMGLPHGKKTQRGWSTDAETLESLREYPLVAVPGLPEAELHLCGGSAQGHWRGRTHPLHL